MSKKRDEALEGWNKMQQGLDPGETVADRVMGNLMTKKAGWHRTRGKFPEKATWKPKDREFGWIYLPDVPNPQSVINPITKLPEESAERRALEDSWEQRSIAMHTKQRRDMDAWMRNHPVFQEYKGSSQHDPDPYKPENLKRHDGEVPNYADLPESERTKDRPSKPPTLTRGD